MKKIPLYVMAACLSLSFQSNPSNAASNNSTIEIPKQTSTPEADAMVLRLNEIKSMDKSSLNHSEKKALRKEVRSIEKKLKEKFVGIYISAVGLIIVILVLILIL